MVTQVNGVEHGGKGQELEQLKILERLVQIYLTHSSRYLDRLTQRKTLRAVGNFDMDVMNLSMLHFCVLGKFRSSPSSQELSSLILSFTLPFLSQSYLILLKNTKSQGVKRCHGLHRKAIYSPIYKTFLISSTRTKPQFQNFGNAYTSSTDQAWPITCILFCHSKSYSLLLL